MWFVVKKVIFPENNCPTTQAVDYKK